MNSPITPMKSKEKIEEERYVRKERFVLYLLFSPIVFLVILPTAIAFIPFLIQPYVPSVKGVVVEEGTNKPIPNINIHAEWMISVGTVGGGTGRIYKTYETITNKDGEFVLPKAMRAMPLCVIPLFVRWYGGIDITTCSNDYKKMGDHADVNETAIKIVTRPYKNADEYLGTVK